MKRSSAGVVLLLGVLISVAVLLRIRPETAPDSTPTPEQVAEDGPGESVSRLKVRLVPPSDGPPIDLRESELEVRLALPPDFALEKPLNSGLALVVDEQSYPLIRSGDKPEETTRLEGGRIHWVVRTSDYEFPDNARLKKALDQKKPVAFALSIPQLQESEREGRTQAINDYLSPGEVRLSVRKPPVVNPAQRPTTKWDDSGRFHRIKGVEVVTNPAEKLKQEAERQVDSRAGFGVGEAILNSKKSDKPGK